MKKLLVLLIVTITALGLGGCSGRPRVTQETYPWQVIKVIRHTLVSEKIADGAVDGLRTFLNEKIDDNNYIRAEVHHARDIFQVELYFDNWRAFLEFNGIEIAPDDEMRVVDMVMRERLFTLERTQTFKNPWLVIADDMDVIDSINNRARVLAGAAAITQTEHIFVFRSAFRRSRVEGHYRTDNLIIAHYYYFRGNGENVPEQIVLFDRFANPPMWYVIGIAATIVFMLVVFMLQVKPKRER